MLICKTLGSVGSSNLNSEYPIPATKQIVEVIIWTATCEKVFIIMLFIAWTLLKRFTISPTACHSKKLGSMSNSFFSIFVIISFTKLISKRSINFCRAIERKKYNPAITIHPTSIYAEFNNDCDCVMLSISACSTKGMDKVNAWINNISEIIPATNL